MPLWCSPFLGGFLVTLECDRMWGAGILYATTLLLRVVSFHHSSYFNCSFYEAGTALSPHLHKGRLCLLYNKLCCCWRELHSKERHQNAARCVRVSPCLKWTGWQITLNVAIAKLSQREWRTAKCTQDAFLSLSWAIFWILNWRWPHLAFQMLTDKYNSLVHL